MSSKRSWTPGEHPRLFFGREDLEMLRAKRGADEITAAAWARLQTHVDRAMTDDLPEWCGQWEWDTGTERQKNLSAVVNQCCRAVGSLGFSWLLDGIEEHARRATDILMALCDFDFWTSPRFFGTEYRPPWRGTIETAAPCHAAAWGYDWLYDFMSERERHRLRTCLLYKGILPLVQDWADPDTRLPAATHMLPWSIWWQVCVASAGEATMAIYREHPLTEHMARLCKEASDWFFRFEGAVVPEMPEERLFGMVPGYHPPNFDSQGGYADGLSYMDGVLIESCLFSEAYRRQTGEDALPMELMRKVAAVILDGSFRMGDRMGAADLGDSRTDFATSPLVTAYLARRLRHQGLQWFLHSCRENFRAASPFRYSEIPAFTLLWYDPSLPAEQPDETHALKVYPDMGWAVMRNGWGHDDSLFILKCGPTVRHAHADAGSFVLYTRDEKLLVDSGSCRFDMPELEEYYHTTRAHSTILVGGEGQAKRLAGRIVEQVGVPGLSFVLGDATPPYEGRLSQFLRGVLFVGAEYYVVVDWLRKRDDKPFGWLLHYDGEMTSEAGGYVVRKQNAGVLVKIVDPARRRLTIRQGYKSYQEDFFNVVKTIRRCQSEIEPADYIEITPVRNTRRRRFLTVLYPFDATAAVPEVEVVRSQEWTGVRIARRDEHDLVALRRTGARSSIEIDGIQTDARLFCVTRDEDGAPLRALMCAGTYLKVDGSLLASSTKPATLVVTGDG